MKMPLEFATAEERQQIVEAMAIVTAIAERTDPGHDFPNWQRYWAKLFTAAAIDSKIASMPVPPRDGVQTP